MALKHWRWWVLGAVVVWIGYVALTPRTSPNVVTGPREELARHRNVMLVLLKSRSDVEGGRVPALSTKEPPDWADTPAKREALVGPNSDIEDAFSARWSYVVPEATVGKEFEGLEVNDELLVSDDFPHGRAVIFGGGHFRIAE